MAEIRILPTNFFAWPRVRDLITQQKFICSYLWVNRYTDACGCYLLPISAAAAEMSMSENSLPDALDEFERRKLIEFDEETGEILIVDWFRWHRLNARSRPLVERGIGKIISSVLKIRAEELYVLHDQVNKKSRTYPSTQQNRTQQKRIEPPHTNDGVDSTTFDDEACLEFTLAMRARQIDTPGGYLKSLVPGFQGRITQQQVRAALARGEELLAANKLEISKDTEQRLEIANLRGEIATLDRIGMPEKIPELTAKLEDLLMRTQILRSHSIS